MSRHIVLHAGKMKTGTTYLQACFLAERSKIAEKEIYYPPIRGSQKINLVTDEMVEESMDYSTILLSSEHYQIASNSTFEVIKDKFNASTIEIVYTIREAISWLNSLYIQELTVSRTSENFSSWLKEKVKTNHILYSNFF